MSNIYLMATDIATRRTFIAELARKGSRKINYSVMPADTRGADVLCQPRDVPAQIRASAKHILIGARREPTNIDASRFAVRQIGVLFYVYDIVANKRLGTYQKFSAAARAARIASAL
jgi:hypothetical protein